MYIVPNNVSVLVDRILQLEPNPNDCVMLFIAEKNHPDLLELITALNKYKINFFGGIFPNLIAGQKKYEEGIIVKVLPTLAPPFLIKNLSNKQYLLPNFEQFTLDEEAASAVVLVDGLTSNIDYFLSSLYNVLGNDVNYLGGGAGSLSLEQQPCLLTKEGIFEDAAIICLIDLVSSLGVRHGWERIDGPFVANKTHKNVIKELNWQNAYEIYRTTVEAEAGMAVTFNNSNFFSIAKGYPFGMSKQYAEYVVRDPITVTESGELVCVGEVPENSVLDILRGQNGSLIHAAHLAAKDCEYKHLQLKHALVFDCISRVLFLEEDFEKELEAVQENLPNQQQNITLEGALTLGEISSYGQNHLEFFNKTIVVGLLGKIKNNE